MCALEHHITHEILPPMVDLADGEHELIEDKHVEPCLSVVLHKQHVEHVLV